MITDIHAADKQNHDVNAKAFIHSENPWDFDQKSKGKIKRFAVLWRNGYDCLISESRFYGERRPLGGKGC